MTSKKKERERKNAALADTALANQSAQLLLLSEEKVDLHFFSANLLKQIGGAYYTMGEEKGERGGEDNK